MATPGPKPKPVAQKEVEGNPGHRSLETIVPAPTQGALLCPRVVSRKARALAYWDHYIANTAPGHLAPVDSPMLGRLCMALAWADEASEKVEETGLLVRGPGEGAQPMESPYFAIVNKQTEIARKLAAELAIPVAERNRVVGVKGKPGGEFSEF